MSGRKRRPWHAIYFVVHAKSFDYDLSMGVRRFKRAVNRFATEVRERRIESGLTQEAVAEAAQMSVRSYQLIEAGKANPTLRKMLSIADALDLTLWELFTE
jgi:DNA-binding XRE family transcriptional regulator